MNNDILEDIGNNSLIKESKQSNYFIKFLNGKNIDENIELMKQLKFDFNNTVGPKSISKQELIFQLNKLL